eukprot:TRINITY_DN82647_c0_g1_i1.p1 TRINITY_DN82647_c0_g1~~TRINITY_DN82647_c0_g1_i1.p1  ORF type:complete len:521 (+),score=71.57 TRINITY_DN82647_c0_g1_i1:134-1696(+)
MLAVPLLNANQADLENKRDFRKRMAIIGWWGAVGISCAYVAQYCYRKSGGAPHGRIESDINAPLVLAETVATKEGLDCYSLLLSAIKAAGYGQILLVVASAAIPFLLDYKKELAEIRRPLLRQMFLVYSGYILVINLLFGLLSAFAPESILEVGFLPSVVAGFMFLYWFARLMVELFFFDLSFLNRPHEICGRRGIEILFTLLPLVYGLAFAHNMGKLSLDRAVPAVGPIGRMLAIIVLLFWVMKVLCISMPKSEGPKLSWFQTLVFFCVWPGMQPKNLLERRPGLDWWRDAGWGAFFVVLGFFWSVGIKLGVDAGWSAPVAGLLSLPGISMLGHVGGLRLLRGALRFVGYDVEQLFVDPLLATSLSDFWGKRWNQAFSDMNRYVFVAAVKTAIVEDVQPNLPSTWARLKSKETANQLGIFAAFVASALLHELGITCPVLAGYGGPTLYFVIQGVAVSIEKSLGEQRLVREHPHLTRMWMFAVLAVPFPVLFVVPFRTEIALPISLFVANLPSSILGLLT